MKIRSFLLISLLPLLMACTSNPTSTPTTPVSPEILHFENELVAFDYPDGTILYTAGDPDFHRYVGYIQVGGELAVGLADPSWIQGDLLYSSIGVYRHALPPGSTLEQVMDSAYATAFADQPVPEEDPERSGPVTVAGLPAISSTNRVASGPLWYILQDIWLEKDGSILRLSLWGEGYEAFTGNFQSVADLFLGSLEVKESLPPFTEQPTPAPTASPTPYPADLLLHFEDDDLSFDYPQGISFLPAGENPADCFPEIPFGGERLVGLGEPRFLIGGIYYRSIQITRLPMPPGSNLEVVLMDIYEQAEVKYPQDPPTLASTGPIPVAGGTGLQWAYRVTAGEPTYEQRDIWLERDDQIYIISIWTEFTNLEDFWAFQSGAQALLDSLVIK